MKKLLISLVMLLTLAGCNTPPVIHDRERCVPVINEVLIDGAPAIDTATNEPIYSGKCRCISYEWNKDHIGPKKDAVGVDHALNYCDRMSGLRPDEWGGYVKDLENFRIWLLQQQNH
jgi:hypothetical protein